MCSPPRVFPLFFHFCWICLTAPFFLFPTLTSSVLPPISFPLLSLRFSFSGLFFPGTMVFEKIYFFPPLRLETLHPLSFFLVFYLLAPVPGRLVFGLLRLFFSPSQWFSCYSNLSLLSPLCLLFFPSPLDV